jgi:hypothetical protein
MTKGNMAVDANSTLPSMPNVTSELFLNGESGTAIPPPALKKTALMERFVTSLLVSESAKLIFCSEFVCSFISLTCAPIGRLVNTITIKISESFFNVFY